MPSKELIKRRMDTLSQKLEYMCVRLGGDPEQDGQIGELMNLDEYQKQILLARNKIKHIREDLDKRNDDIKIHGFQTKERILSDQRIKKKIEEAEEELKTVEVMVKKKAAKYSAEDLKNRNKTIELLRKNLSLLRDEVLGDKANISEDRDGPKKIFGDYRDTDSDKISSKDIEIGMKDEEHKYVHRDLTEEEKQALQQFKKNDEELDAILDRVIAGLSDLEDKGNKINQAIDRQKELLDKANKDVGKTELRLRQQNNNLKDVLQKIRSTNKLC